MFITLKDWKTRSANQTAVRAELTARARTALALADDDALSINEIACSDPGCPDVETVILVMRHRQPTKAIKIQKQMADVTDDDLAELAPA